MVFGPRWPRSQVDFCSSFRAFCWWRLCPPRQPCFQSCSWIHWFPGQPEGRCEFPSWIKVPVALYPQASHTLPLSNQKKKFIWISPYNLHGDPDFFPLPRKKWCSHPICPWRCPSFLRNQASWLHCNLSSLMDSRKAMILYIIWFFCGYLEAMLFPAFYPLGRSQKCWC